MQLGFKYGGCKGFFKLYNYGLKHYPSYMITKQAEKRKKILLFWKQYGLQATTDAYGAKQSTLYGWWKVYKESGYKVESLNPGKQARKNVNKREIHPLILKEIRRLRTEECPNMGKAKVKKNLDKFCKSNSLPIYSESKIGRIIKEKKIYHHRQKIYHNGTIKTIKKEKKLRKPNNLVVDAPGELVEIDTVVRFIKGIKRYVITAVDVYGRYGFAFCYKRPLSSNAKDFFHKLNTVFPYEIKAVQTDNGSEFHKYFREYLKEQDIIHYWNYPGRPYRQGHIEKFNRTIQEEFIDWNEVLLDDVNMFNQKMIDWLIWYNTKRFHWSLNLETPVDYLINNNLVSNMRWTNTYYCQNGIISI
jgi:transposase InsO family protein